MGRVRRTAWLAGLVTADLALRSGDPADQIRAKVRGYLDGLVEDCREFGYLRR